MKDDRMTDEDGRDEWYTWRMIRWRMRHDEWQDERWTMVKGDMANRHDIFPEDDILDIITISRYNYHK